MSVQQLEIPYSQDSAQLFTKIADEDWPIWLDSGVINGQAFPGHHIDILAANPIEKLVYDPQGTFNNTLTPQPRSLDACFHLIAGTLAQYAHQQPNGPGWLGYFSYDLFNELEPVAKRNKPEILPGITLGFYSWVIINNHHLNKAYIYYLSDHKQAALTVASKLKGEPYKTPQPFQLTSKFKAITNRATYRNQFAAIQNYIHGGDCYQVNLTQQFTAQCNGCALDAFMALRQAHPSPMSAYFKTESFEILSLSPERFFKKASRHISSYPIKGTRPRSPNQHQDQALKIALKNSSKDRAENVMIVDLLRNDLGRICETGSVKTSKLFEVESFPNVHHLVSTIEGTLRNNVSIADIFKAIFPGGSITGAPKVRAMEIIEELEDHRRSIYCGSLVHLVGNADIDSNIAIRTLLKTENSIHCWGGGGIVADSDCDNEYQETLDKVGKLMAILEQHFRVP